MKLFSKHALQRRVYLFGLVLLALDVLLLCLTYTCTLQVRYAANWLDHFNPFALWIVCLTSLAFVYIVDGYRIRRNPSDLRYYSEYLIAGIINLLAALLIIYFFTETEAARAAVGTTLVIFPCVSVIYRRWLHRSTYRDMGKRLLLVIGVDERAQAFYRSLRACEWPHECHFFDVSGKRGGETLIQGDAQSPIIRTDVWKELADRGKDIDSIVLASNVQDVPGSLVEWLVSRHYLELNVQTLDKFYTSNWKIEPLDRVSPYWAFEDGFLLNQSYSFERGKRIFDIMVALLSLLITLPVTLLVALAIKLESEGPVFFRQARVGLGQSHFRIFKFRSMCVGADKGDAYTRSGDKRITRVGHFLRKTRLDELPQMINVLSGEMSIIGPRPEWDKLVERYQRGIPYYHFRHLVKPGITGWAQVNYPYGESEQDAIEKLKYDLYYVRYYSFLLDLTICMKTLYVILFGKGR